MYGKLFNHAMGAFWQISSEQTDEKNFVPFVANGAFGYETVYLRDEKGIRGSGLHSNRANGDEAGYGGAGIHSQSSSSDHVGNGSVKENITMYRPAHGVFVDRANK